MQGNAFSTVPWQLCKDPQEASESWKEDLRFTQKGMKGGVLMMCYFRDLPPHFLSPPEGCQDTGSRCS